MHKFMKFAAPSRTVLGAFSLAAILLSASGVSAQEAKPAPAASPAPSAETDPPESQASEEAEGEDATEATAPPAAPSPEQREAAMKAFEAGTAAFNEEKYEEALAQFQAAYEAIPSPHAEYWIAVSLDKADPEDEDPKKIATAYQTLLNNPGVAHIGADKVEEAQKRFLELRKFLPAKITIVSTPPGASVKVDGQAQEGVTPIDLEVKEGTHVIELSLEGYQDAIVDAQVSGGVHLEQQVEMTELPPPPPPAEPMASSEPVPEEKRSVVPAAITLGLGGAGLIAGTVFGIMALNSKSQFKDDPTTDNADAAERNALIADMSFGVALTLGITGIVLLTAKDDPTATAKRKARKELIVAPYASPRGAGAAARLTF